MTIDFDDVNSWDEEVDPDWVEVPRFDVRGEFSLDESSAFLAGFPPAGRADAAQQPDVLRLAFPLDADGRPAGIRMLQMCEVVEGEVVAPPGAEAAALAQAARILSLDVDGDGFADVLSRDPVLAEVARSRLGLRPVLFSSPFEAAVWTVLSQRIRYAQAARLRQRLVDQHGVVLAVDGVALPVFPAPARLVDLESLPGVPEVKVQRLRGLARAALDGRLDAARLRAQPPDEALDGLQQLPGVGPFGAELILVRGAGAVDVFPRHEKRLHAEMARRYGLPDEPSIEELADVAEAWRPYRSWAAFHLRVAAESG